MYMTVEQAAATVRALERERSGYALAGNDARVAEVDAELARYRRFAGIADEREVRPKTAPQTRRKGA